MYVRFAMESHFVAGRPWLAHDCILTIVPLGVLLAVYKRPHFRLFLYPTLWRAKTKFHSTPLVSAVVPEAPAGGAICSECLRLHEKRAHKNSFLPPTFRMPRTRGGLGVQAGNCNPKSRILKIERGTKSITSGRHCLGALEHEQSALHLGLEDGDLHILVFGHLRRCCALPPLPRPHTCIPRTSCTIPWVRT